MFAATAAATAQIAESARGANGLAVGLLGAAFALRAVGDAGPHGLAWLSPLGWGQAIRAFADERWWLLAPLLALAALLTFIAFWLAGLRDLGAGLRAPRPGPARGALGTPLQLAWRLQRGALAGWAAGFAILGAAFGSIAQDIGDVIGDSPEVLDALKRLGGARSLADTYLAATFGVLALIAAGYAVQAVLRLRGEETGGRAEPLLATSVSRTRWALSHTAVALAGTAVLMGVAGLTAGIAHRGRPGTPDRWCGCSARRWPRRPRPGCSPASRWRSSGSPRARPWRAGACLRRAWRWPSSVPSWSSRRR